MMGSLRRHLVILVLSSFADACASLEHECDSGVADACLVLTRAASPQRARTLARRALELEDQRCAVGTWNDCLRAIELRVAGAVWARELVPLRPAGAPTDVASATEEDRYLPLDEAGARSIADRKCPDSVRADCERVLVGVDPVLVRARMNAAKEQSQAASEGAEDYWRKVVHEDDPRPLVPVLEARAKVDIYGALRGHMDALRSRAAARLRAQTPGRSALVAALLEDLARYVSGEKPNLLRSMPVPPVPGTQRDPRVRGKGCEWLGPMLPPRVVDVDADVAITIDATCVRRESSTTRNETYTYDGEPVTEEIWINQTWTESCRVSDPCVGRDRYNMCIPGWRTGDCTRSGPVLTTTTKTPKIEATREVTHHDFLVSVTGTIALGAEAPFAFSAEHHVAEDTWTTPHGSKAKTINLDSPTAIVANAIGLRVRTALTHHLIRAAEEAGRDDEADELCLRAAWAFAADESIWARLQARFGLTMFEIAALRDGATF